jgi:hypothetical protein
MGQVVVVPLAAPYAASEIAMRMLLGEKFLKADDLRF